MRKRVRSYGAGRRAGRKGGNGGNIPFRVPFCLVWFPSHVRHRVYNSFLVTPMGLRHGLCLSARVHFTRSVRFGARAGWKKYCFWNTYANMGFVTDKVLSVYTEFSSPRKLAILFSFWLHTASICVLVKESHREIYGRKGMVLSKK